MHRSGSGVQRTADRSLHYHGGFYHEIETVYESSSMYNSRHDMREQISGETWYKEKDNQDCHYSSIDIRDILPRIRNTAGRAKRYG